MEVFDNGAVPLTSPMCRALGITQAIDGLTGWDERQCRLSPRLLVEAIIVNLSGSRKPLYLIHEYFQHMDVATRFGPGIQARDLNDNALARALDKLARAGPLYGTIALAAARLGFPPDIYLREIPPMELARSSNRKLWPRVRNIGLSLTRLSSKQ
jgi:hypothetical protein